MKDYKIKTFTYKCKCGFAVNVFVDYGTPQDEIKCRSCQKSIKRDDI